MLPATSVAQLAQSIDLVVDAVRGAPVDQYDNPTPCSAWTVRDLVNHIAMMLLMTRDVGIRTAPDPSLLTANPVPLLAGRPEPEWAFLLAGAAEPAARAWSEPAAWEGEAGLGGPPMPATALGGILIAEFTIHAWDMTAATGQRGTVPASLAETAFATYSREAPRMRGLGLLGDEVPQDADAPVLDRALALSGRNPRWEPAAH
ncbi:TIGR03086 family metal-binding protein [Streptomyces acidicola]|uniref:TIGR03086 family protein n=1 Tax=Streptomyces acidicola TaxID=2596892 RepID=A0A5N8WYL1_9ACTN|nr:TIGR03086 family metal-binding protein [Streptomyces acidicola]MPY52427.1 TIGR03086 family protein [Streptomyces acidicola]